MKLMQIRSSCGSLSPKDLGQCVLAASHTRSCCCNGDDGVLQNTCGEVSFTNNLVRLFWFYLFVFEGQAFPAELSIARLLGVFPSFHGDQRKKDEGLQQWFCISPWGYSPWCEMHKDLFI